MLEFRVGDKVKEGIFTYTVKISLYFRGPIPNLRMKVKQGMSVI